MTALRKYQRLECSGLWRAAPDQQRRDVSVSFGEASLVLSDMRSQTPLAHWSLPAVIRRNPGEVPAVFTPDVDLGETLELDDPDMIDALETVQRSLRAGRQPAVRLRMAGVLGFLALAVVLVSAWLPNALVRHASNVVPAPKREEIARMILADLAQSGHPTCTDTLGLRALTRLRERVLGTGRPRLAVLSGDRLAGAVALPGQIVVVGQSLIEGQDSPEVVAGHVLAAALAAEAHDPLEPVLRAAGLRANLMLLTTGDLPASALRGYGEILLDRPRAAPEVHSLVTRFEVLQIAATPYAYAVDASGETTLELIEADLFRAASPPRPVLSDGDWVSLQGICSN